MYFLKAKAKCVPLNLYDITLEGLIICRRPYVMKIQGEARNAPEMLQVHLDAFR